MRNRIHEIIFEADTRGGKLFDVVLLILILTSVIAVMLDSVENIRQRHGELLLALEYVLTSLFAVEYLLRLYCVRKPMAYALSFFGVVDFVAIVPGVISFFVVGTQSLLVVRVLRILRIFRVFKLRKNGRTFAGKVATRSES